MCSQRLPVEHQYVSVGGGIAVGRILVPFAEFVPVLTVEEGLECIKVGCSEVDVSSHSKDFIHGSSLCLRVAAGHELDACPQVERLLGLLMVRRCPHCYRRRSGLSLTDASPLEAVTIVNGGVTELLDYDQGAPSAGFHGLLSLIIEAQADLSADDPAPPCGGVDYVRRDTLYTQATAARQRRC